MADATKEAKVEHIVTANKSKYIISELASTYKDIGDIVGIKEMGADEKADAHSSVPKLKQDAKIITLRVSTKEKKSFTLQCSIDKASTAVTGLVGRKIGSNTIKKVRVPRRRRRR